MLGAVLTGCSPGPPAPGATGTSCGTTRTGAGVPVRIKVEKGTVDCATALSVERDYAAMIAGGRVRGTGGGGRLDLPGVCHAGDAADRRRLGVSHHER